jgi:hypothetical protein
MSGRVFSVSVNYRGRKPKIIAWGLTDRGTKRVLHFMELDPEVGVKAALADEAAGFLKLAGVPPGKQE